MYSLEVLFKLYDVEQAVEDCENLRGVIDDPDLWVDINNLTG